MSALVYFASLIVTAFAMYGLVDAAPRPNGSAFKEEIEKKDFVKQENRTLGKPPRISVTGNAEGKFQDVIIAGMAAVCPPGYEPVEVYCYKINLQPGDFRQHKDLCFQSGGYLTSILTEEESDALIEYLRSLKLDVTFHRALHIGLIDVRYGNEQRPYFSWSDELDTPYKNWVPDRPSYWECAYVVLDEARFGKWEDGPCHNIKGGICEANPLAIITLANK